MSPLIGVTLAIADVASAGAVATWTGCGQLIDFDRKSFVALHNS